MFDWKLLSVNCDFYDVTLENSLFGDDDGKTVNIISKYVDQVNCINWMCLTEN